MQKISIFHETMCIGKKRGDGKTGYQILGAASLRVLGKVPGGLVCILTLTASMGERAMSPKNSAVAPAA